MNEDGTGHWFGVGSNWLSLVSTAVIYPAVLVVGLTGEWNVFELTAILGVGVVLQVVVLVVGHIGLALLTKKEPDDERIVEIQRRASRVSGGVLSALVGMLVVGLIGRAMVLTVRAGADGGGAVGGGGEGIVMGVDLFPIYALFGVFIVSELVRYGVVIFGSRA